MRWNIATILKHLVPLPLYYAVREQVRDRVVPDDVRYAVKYPDRQDVRRLAINDQAELHVFWKVLSRGCGPAFSLFVCGDEVLRLDCFGDGEGHYHTQFYCPDTPKRTRLHFFETTASAQVERAMFEITHNLDYYLQRHPRKCVRKTQMVPEVLQSVCRQGEMIAKGYLANVPELAELSSLKTHA